MVKTKKTTNKKSLIQKPVKMVNGKKSITAQKNKQELEEEMVVDAEGYDSMIENGTSEESDSDNEQQNEEEDATDSEEESGSDDGFSDKEEEEVEQAVAKTNKRKPEVQQEVAQNKKSKITNPFAPEKVKAPTLEEINELKETRNLFHSNIFRLQVKEMLQELKVKDKYTNYINSFLEQFKTFVKTLKNMPEKEDMDKLLWLKKSKLSVPLNLQSLKVQQQKVFQFQFVKPTTEPFFLGASNTHTLLGPKLQADIGVLMPAECWQKENYLNLQYDQKRAYYLTYLTQKLLESKLIAGLSLDQLKFNYYNNNPLKPVLEITPPAEAGKHLAQKLCLRIFIASEQQSFKLNRFVPWNNNIRSSVFDSNEDEESVPLATPSYNANILFDLTMHENQKLLQEVFAPHNNFQEGLLLLKVWLRQRQLDVGYGGFNAHIMAMFVAYLFKQRKLHSNMSSYQVARNVWNQLSFSAWHESNKGITLCNTFNSIANQPTLEQFHSYYPVVFIDATGFYNICSNVSADVYKRICLEAKLAVDMLNDMKLNSFQCLFMSKMPLYTQMDHILKINKPDAIEQILEMHVTPADKYNYAGYTYPQLLKVISSLLQKGLSKRVEFMLPLEQLTPAWSVNESATAVPQHLHLGFILNPEHAYEILDKGPESIDDEAAKFRAFWGEKAQLRRFQDGSITESVVWAAANDDLSKKRLIVRSIVMYLLQHHFQLEDKDVEYVAGEFETVFELTKGFKVDNLKFGKQKINQDTNAEAMALLVIREFDDLARKLNDLKELPLEIVSIAGISPVLRYCEPQPILPRARCIKEQIFADHIQYGVVQLGQSGKWPSELTALRALKTAFYLQIAEMLQEKYKLTCKVTYDGVLVLKQGYCFNLEIAHPKEVGLLKKEKTVKGLTTHIDCPESIALEKRHYILPKVTGALKALYQNHSSFGATVMIAKRWLYSQLIDNGLWPEECTELLIASQYMKIAAKCITNSPQTGFIRFLQLLANTDWKSELFLLNFNSAMQETDISDLEQHFATERDTFPPLCLATSYDQKHYGKIWSSEQQPNVHVLARVTLLARQSLEIIESTLLSSSLTFIRPVKIFKPPTQGYDFVIQLSPDKVTNTLSFEFGSSFVEFTKPNWHMPLAGSNFLQNAVNKLREAYSEFAAFFYNPCGGKEIAVIWKPSAFNAKEFKVNDVTACSLTADHKRVQAKKEVLIEDFKFILKDFYLRMGSLEFVRQANNNTPQKTTGNKARYFGANDKTERKQEKPALNKKPAVIAKNKHHKKPATTTKFKAKSQFKSKVKANKALKKIVKN
ncbi:nucleolar protein 6 [Calliphora vicina]|uniref:nucleolar protein 6 n=1 Tax=Calliphora vicina TaxID=7373 RepID=UPI00325A5CC4